MRNIKTSKANFHLDCLVFQEKKKWLVHCLDLDIVAEGKTVEEAAKELAALIKEQVKFAVDNDLEKHIFHPAPPSYWKKLAKVRAKKAEERIIHKRPFSQKELLKSLNLARAN